MDKDKSIMVEKTLQELLDTTTTFSFPVLANEKSKEEILKNEKKVIDDLIDQIIKDYDIPIDATELGRSEMWTDAKKIALDKFSTLPKKLQINSFFFQEIMHEYVDGQAKRISASLSKGA